MSFEFLGKNHLDEKSHPDSAAPWMFLYNSSLSSSDSKDLANS